ncbi:MAG: DUF1425 domain-containing protein [Planctomycetes bacterium]|nr:DUF1425 domain-containing protein [Planctomycetota bacterium]
MMPIHPPHIRWVAVAATVIASWSCKSIASAPGDRAPILLTTPIDGDPALAEHVRMLDAHFVTVGSSVEARFALQLEQGPRRSLLVHVDWFDALGASIEVRPQSWIPVELSADASITLRVVAPAHAAPSFRLKFHRPDVAR